MAEPKREAAIPSTVNPWNTAVEIQSIFIFPEEGVLKKPSGLLLRRLDAKMAMASGSGTIIGRQGSTVMVLTAQHVVMDAKSYMIKFRGHVGTGYNVVHHESSDISIFYVDSLAIAALCQVAPIASRMPDVGSRLDCLGNALGRGMRWMTPGVLASDKSNQTAGEPLWEGSYLSYPGCSGGGIWNNGKLVGVVSRVLVSRVPLHEHGEDEEGKPKVDSGVYHDVMADMGYFVGAEMIYPFTRK